MKDETVITKIKTSSLEPIPPKALLLDVETENGPLSLRVESAAVDDLVLHFVQHGLCGR